MLGGGAGDIIDSGTEIDIVLGDHGVIDYALGVSGVSTGDGNPATLDRVQTLFPTIGGTDDIRAGAGDDFVLGGMDKDKIQGNAGDDLVFGDHGLIERRSFGNIDPSLLPLDGTLPPQDAFVLGSGIM